MNVSAIICSVNRPAILHETVVSVARQTHPAREIVIVTPDRQHVLPETLDIPGVRFVSGRLGLPAQRNAGLEHVAQDCELIAFFDDDVELSERYLEKMSGLFAANQQILIASGRMLHDGGRSAMITREQAKAICAGHDANPGASLGAGECKPTNSGYGCNMMVRFSATRNIRFDEGLPLYAWLEDRDYSHRVTLSVHPPVEFESAVAVHLGSRSGRIGGVRMGFSEIINPIYLWAKNRTFPLHYIVVQYWARCLVGNVLGILTRDSEYDRVGLLKGNLLGFRHLLGGSCDPAYIIKL